MPPSPSQKLVQVSFWCKAAFQGLNETFCSTSQSKDHLRQLSRTGILPLWFRRSSPHLLGPKLDVLHLQSGCLRFTKSFANIFRYHRFVVDQHSILVKLDDKTAARCWRWHATGPEVVVFGWWIDTREMEATRKSPASHPWVGWVQEFSPTSSRWYEHQLINFQRLIESDMNHGPS